MQHRAAELPRQKGLRSLDPLRNWGVTSVGRHVYAKRPRWPAAEA